MPRKSHPDVVATLDFLANVAAAYALVADDARRVATPATAWWNLPQLYTQVPPIPEPRWVVWVSDLNNGIWPDAPNRDLAEICMAMQSYPSGTLIQNFKHLCDLRECEPTATALKKGAVRDLQLDEHYRLRADNHMLRLLSEENQLLLQTAVARDVPWYTLWPQRTIPVKPAPVLAAAHAPAVIP